MPRFDYPNADRLELVEELHGRPVADPYRWLEEAGDPRTEAWLLEQDALLDTARQAWPMRGAFQSRLTELLGSGEINPPLWRGDRQFFTRRTAGQEHAILLTVGPDGEERVLVDPMELDPSGTTTLDGWEPSDEGSLLAYLVSEGGTEESALYVLDLATGERVEGPIHRARYSSIAWLPGGKSYYYVRRLAPDLVPADQSQYHRRLWLHEVGTSPDADVLVFGEDQPMTNYHFATLSADGRWLSVVTSTGTAPRNDAWLADLTASSPDAPDLKPIQVGVDAMTDARVGRAGTPFEDRVYLLTDRDAPRGRICVTPVADLSYEAWTDLVPECTDCVLESFEILDGPELERAVLLVNWTCHAVSELTLHDLASGEKLLDIELPGLGTVSGLTGREAGHEAWFSYSDFTTPGQVYRFDALTNEVTVWAAAPGEVDVPTARTRQVTYTSKDGTEVRMFVIDGGEADGPRPTILYGYGGFNLAQMPGYNPRILSWVEAGGVFAIASLRGGSEEGEAWHRDGMMAKKQNVFDDFHAAGDWLVDQGVTTREQLGIYGGSNGGLLVGVALTQHPEKYAAVVCWAPLLDMVRYERFGLGVTWNEEYGTAEDPEQFGWLIAYSPYHNVRDVTSNTDYPATLFTVFDGDSRVDPLHARKLAAALQHATAGERPILFRNEREAGHAARSVSKSVGVYADMFGFLAAQLGLVNP